MRIWRLWRLYVYMHNLHNFEWKRQNERARVLVVGGYWGVWYSGGGRGLGVGNGMQDWPNLAKIRLVFVVPSRKYILWTWLILPPPPPPPPTPNPNPPTALNHPIPLHQNQNGLGCSYLKIFTLNGQYCLSPRHTSYLSRAPRAVPV